MYVQLKQQDCKKKCPVEAGGGLWRPAIHAAEDSEPPRLGAVTPSAKRKPDGRRINPELTAHLSAM